MAKIDSESKEEGLSSALGSAQSLVLQGRFEAAKAKFSQLAKERQGNATQRALLQNDAAVTRALMGDYDHARRRLRAAISRDMMCQVAWRNLDLLEEFLAGVNRQRLADGTSNSNGCRRIAILSFLFNWPSGGGGIVHTVELVKFLSRAGYCVQHFYADMPEFGIGTVDQTLPIPSTGVRVRNGWSAAQIQASFRAAVDEFRPDIAIITDAWNFKPLLAEAIQGYPYVLRQQALELVCPLNNLRLLIDQQGTPTQCDLNQLAVPGACASCLIDHGHQSGQLHQMERELSGVGTPKYLSRLKAALHGATSVLVLNPEIASLFRPFARDVRVVTWGMDGERFPWPWPVDDFRLANPGTAIIFMAGLVGEYIKGFQVLQSACANLWGRRQDFLLVVTGEPVGWQNEYTRFVGWLDQATLPKYLRAADIVVVPTIAQDGLSRTSVEAMAVGRPVVASDIGGLPYSVSDGITGLLFEPGNAMDLADKLEQLVVSPTLRETMGRAGRKRFESDFLWENVIDQFYRPILNAVPTR